MKKGGFVFRASSFMSDVLFYIGTWIAKNISRLPIEEARKRGRDLATPAEIVCAVSHNPPYFKG